MSAQTLLRVFLAGLCVLPLVMASQAIGATVRNLDAGLFILTVTEHGARTEVSVRTRETIEFCINGCFVALPNGNRAALVGDEVIQISGGRITTKWDGLATAPIVAVATPGDLAKGSTTVCTWQR